MKIALTGGSGFVGRYLIDTLLEQGHQVRSLTRDLEGKPTRPGLSWIAGDLRDDECVEELIDSVDAVIHSALDRGPAGFMSHPADPVDYFDANVLGSLRLLQCATAGTPTRWVFLSSGAVHELVSPDRPLDESHPLWPKSIYGAAKASVETLVHAYGLSGRITCCTIRPTSIYGLDDPPSKSKWIDLVREVAKGGRVEPTGGAKYVHAADVAKAASMMLTQQEDQIRGRTFNCCDRFISHFQVAQIAKQLSGSDAELMGTAKLPGNPMSTAAIESVGMTFGGEQRLRETVEQLLP